MIDTPYFSVVLEKAYPKNSNQILLSNSPTVSVANGVLKCDLSYYTVAGPSKEYRIKLDTKEFIYQSQKEKGDQAYTVLITPTPGTKDWGPIVQVLITVITEENVSLGIDFVDRDAMGYAGYIQKYKGQ